MPSLFLIVSSRVMAMCLGGLKTNIIEMESEIFIILVAQRF
jgi:hypothetical protein